MFSQGRCKRSRAKRRLRNLSPFVIAACLLPSAALGDDPRPSGASSPWDGLYLGANFGAAAPLHVREQLNSFYDARSVDLYPRSKESTGLSFGLQGGYNWSLDRFVYGVEADFSFLGGRGGANDFVLAPGVYDGRPVYGYLLSYNSPATYFGSLRGRLGLSLGDSLVYLTGGVASGGIRGPASLEFLEKNGRRILNANASGSHQMKYAFGAGVETAVAADTTAKIEALFLSQGQNTQYFQGDDRGSFASSVLNENIVARVGVNHRFGAENRFQSSKAEESKSSDEPEELYSFHGVSTSAVQGYPAFDAHYSGKNSFRRGGQTRSGTTSDLFLGMRLWEGAGAYVNPELNQGFGLENTVGAASYVNAMTTRVGSASPYLRMQRFFIRQTIGLGGDQQTEQGLGGASEMLEATAGQIARKVDRDRITLTVGKYSVQDIFDANDYAHDPTTDFLNYAFTTLGTFDYAADAWGYSIGATAELKKDWWTIRSGIFQLSQTPGRSKLDPVLFHQIMGVVEAEGRYEIAGQPGTLKFLAFCDNGLFGKFDEVNAYAIATDTLPNMSQFRTRRQKCGVGTNLAQQIRPGVGLFLRAGVNDGRYETIDYTDINRTVAGGLVFSGDLWGRENDKIGIGASISGISGPFIRYLQLGGLGAFIGDGALTYAPEKNMEVFYNWGVFDWLQTTLDYQYFANPGFNVTRGPMNLFALRVRAAF
jgi:high affinity Mn2+ porin